MKDTRKILNESIDSHQKAIDKAKRELENLEVTYSRGDRFKDRCGQKTILVICDDGRVVLCYLSNGSRWRSPTKVSCSGQITAKEMAEIGCPEYFDRYWDNRKQVMV
ncbi:MAG: hypothetical protein KAS32_29845 [Candidatus Peribacteraceae bacterium]|nr:hypothetical protein [Candidatus Peribacteraceae bacterium]